MRFFMKLTSKNKNTNITKIIDEKFFESIEFFKILQKIINSESDVISDCVSCFKEKYSFISKKEFELLFDSVFSKLQANVIWENYCTFPSTNIMYNGLKFKERDSGFRKIEKIIIKTPELNKYITEKKIHDF